MHYQCSPVAAAVGSRCTGVRSGVATGRGSRGIGAAQKVIGPSMGVKHKEVSLPQGGSCQEFFLNCDKTLPTSIAIAI